MLYTTTALLHLSFFALLAHSAQLNYTGEAVTTRFWDCCKPSCGWDGKADVSHPVSSCSPDDKPVDIATGTGCNGGGAFQCSNQQPWAINDTLSYGFAGVFITPDLTGGGIEDAWCCACYRLDFTSEPLRGKSMVVQASNTAYDIHANRFSLAVSFCFPSLLFIDENGELMGVCVFRFLVVIIPQRMRVHGNTASNNLYLATTRGVSRRRRIVIRYPRV
jgi:hypothetical protein